MKYETHEANPNANPIANPKSSSSQEEGDFTSPKRTCRASIVSKSSESFISRNQFECLQAVVEERESLNQIFNQTMTMEVIVALMI